MAAVCLADQPVHFRAGGFDALYERVERQLPAIFAFWHGQHFLTPFIKTKDSHRPRS